MVVPYGGLGGVYVGRWALGFCVYNRERIGGRGVLKLLV
jgi:hypothetical protein